MRLAPAIILGVVLLASGCAKNNAHSITGSPPDDFDRPGPEAAWPFWPAQMRVHPLTRIVEDNGQRILEARLEFTDRDGHTSRAFGFVRIELFDGEPQPGREQAIGWSVDLRDLAANATHYDDVSRMYLMRLEVDETLMPDEPVLAVEYYSLNGTDLRVVHRLRR